MNNKIFKSIIKYFPLYVLSLVCLFVYKYISSLSGLFIGEALALFTKDSHLMPDFLLNFMDFSSLKNSVISLAIIYILVSTIGILLDMSSRSFRVVYCNKTLTELTKKYYKHILDIPKSEYSKRSTGDIMQRSISDCERITQLFRSSLFEIFKIVFTTGTLLLQIYLLDKFIFGFSIVALLICISFSIYYGYFKIKPKEIASSNYYSELNSTIQQSITNYSLVKSFTNEEYEYDKFKKINDKKEKNNCYISNLYCKYWLISDLINAVYTIVCYITCGYLFFNNKISLAGVSAIVILTKNFLDGAPRIVDHITTFVKTHIAVKRLNEYFSLKSEYENDGILESEIKGNIEFRNVCMKYEDKYVLDNISFTLKEGETLGIVGKSGAGKTSIVNLLTRLDDYESGRCR